MKPIKFNIRMPKDWPLIISKLDGGVNYSVPEDSIKDSELSGALNYFYDPNTYRLMHRPGVSRYSGTVLAGSGTELQIKGSFYSSILDKVFIVANSVLYYLDSSKNPQSIGTLNGSGYPFFLDFNGQCLIASGGVLETTDGLLLADVSGAPILSKIFTKDGRVWGTGDTANPHRVWGSGPGDETDWDSVGGNAVYFDVEQNVGDRVVNADIYKNNVIVFKGIQQRGIFAIVVPLGVYADAYVQEISTKSSALNIHCSIEEGNDLLFLDNTGFRSLVGVQQYGDIEQDPVGYKINSTLLPTLDSSFAFLARNPYYNQVLIKYADVQTCFVFNPTKKSFLPIEFTSLKPYSACYMENDKTFLIGMDDGFLYKMETSVFTDNGVAVPAFFKTKKFTGKVGGSFLKVLKSVIFDYEGLASGSASLQVIVNGGEKTVSLSSITPEAGSGLLFDATGYIDAATGLLYGESFSTSFINKFVNFYDIIFLVSNDTGAIRFNRLEGRCSTLKRR